MHAIPEDVILRTFESEESPQTVCLDGPPGAGKTTFIRHLVHKWSEDFLMLDGDPVILDKENGPFSLVVYLSARSIRGSVKDAIRNALWCKPEDKDLLMNHVETGEGVAIILDALDEVRKNSILVDLGSFVKNAQNRNSYKILVATRTNICKIEQASFDRTVVLQGFTQQQTMEYVKQYFPVPQPPAEPHPILNYIEKHWLKLQSVLSNPLKIHILCELVSRGLLELKPDETLDIVKLFKPLERFLIKREIEKSCPDGSGNVRLGKEESKEEAESFYQLCFYGMINDIREFSEDLLNSFNISKVYIDTFLATNTDFDIEAKQEQGRTFQHEMLYEYFTSSYIESASKNSLHVLLLAICCRRDFRNIQKIVFEQLSKTKMQTNVLVSMIRCILVMQHTDLIKRKARCFKFKIIKKVKSIKKSVDKNFLGEKALYLSNDEELHHEADAIWGKIDNCFDKYADDLRTLAWFSSLEWNGILDHVVDCLQVCSPEQQEQIIARSIHLLLPCTCKQFR